METSQFDRSAGAWDEDPLKVRLASAVAETMIRRLRLNGSETVLDYGAGTGLVSFRLLPHVSLVIAADTSQEMLAVLAAKAASAGTGAIEPTLWGIDQAWPDRPGLPRPDVVTASMVLHHVEDTSQAARAFHALLPPGGRIALADLDLEDGSFHGGKMHAWHNGFSREALCAIFEEAGFESIRFDEACNVNKPGPDGQTRSYPVFLMTGRKL